MDASSKMSEPQEEFAKEQFTQPDNVSLAYQDKASVFTGVAVDKNAFYFGNSLGEIKALSKKNQKVLWNVSMGYSLYANPVCANGLVIVPTADGELKALSVRNGKIVWTVKADGPFVADGCVVDG